MLALSLLVYFFFVSLVKAEDAANTTWYSGYSDSCIAATTEYYSPQNPLWSCLQSAVSSQIFTPPNGSTPGQVYRQWADSFCTGSPCVGTLP